jgi:uncharacterized damage-inducible protein DinB
MRAFVESIEAEFLRYRALAEAALAQLEEPQWQAPESTASDGNSIATVWWHIAANLHSRFTDFLTSDGEKSWRQREAEFAPRAVSRAELLAHWQMGFGALLQALAALTDADLTRRVAIRGQPLTVHAALHRSLAHVSYHVGQIVHAARAQLGPRWRFLSIPPGGSAAYNAAPVLERGKGHAEQLRERGPRS